MSLSQDAQKRAAADAALDYIEDDTIIGIGTGSTVNYFIQALAPIKHRIEGAVSSSNATTERLQQIGIPVIDLNAVSHLPLYVDGADEADRYCHLIKGGGGALTREKIIAAVADKFICVIDESKQVSCLGTFPLPVEVIPMARSYVARELVKLGGDPAYRQGMVTDNGNIILDVHRLHIAEPVKLEREINNITGVVAVGLFAHRGADKLIVAGGDGIQTLSQ